MNRMTQIWSNRWFLSLLLAPALLVLFSLAAGAAFRANSIVLELGVRNGRLGLWSHGATVDFGSIESGQTLLLGNLGPNERRSPVCLILEQGLVKDLHTLLSGCLLSDAAQQRSIPVSVAQLTEEPLRLRFWNPFRPAINLQLQNGRSLGSVRFHVHENRIEIRLAGSERLEHFDSPFVGLIAAGVGFALFAGAALLLSTALIWGLTPLRWRLAARGPVQIGGASPRPRAPRLRRLEWMAPFAVGAFAVGYVHFEVFRCVPGFGDEMNYLVQARLIAAGHVSTAEPENAEFFTVDWMDLIDGDGKLWNFHPIGHSLLLALGLMLGSASLVPISVGGGIFAVLFVLARRLTGSSAFAWLGVLVAASSHYVLSIAASFMAHAPALLFIELGTLSLVLFLQTGKERHVIALGAFLGLAFLIRPLSAALAALVPAGVLLVALLQRRVRVRTVLLAVALGLAIASVELWRTYLSCGRFTLAYLAKGPESDLGFAQRWARGWEWRLQNLYLNFRYYQDRIFGLGPFGNLVFLFLPVLSALRSAWVVLSYLAMLAYWVIHSWLHFYGWKWEPRMVFEFTHLSVLLTTLGMWRLMSGRRPGATSRSVIAGLFGGALTVMFLAFNLGQDLPDRFQNEYRNYNSTDPFIRDEIRRRGLRDILVFHDDPTFGFAPHMPENQVSVAADGKTEFSGPAIHAIHLGELRDYALISRHATRRVFRSSGPRHLVETPNFYREALPQLVRLLPRYHETHEVVLGLPWNRYADPRSMEALRGVRVVEDEGLLRLILGDQAGTRPYLVVCVGALAEAWKALQQTYTIRVLHRSGPNEAGPFAFSTSFPISIVELDPASRRSDAPVLGLRRSVYEGANCLGSPKESSRVALFEFDAAQMRNACVEWAAEFELPEAQRLTFALSSDDGSGLILDGRVVVDNGLWKSQGRTRREGTIQLEAGHHTLHLAYIQVSGPASLDVHFRIGGEPFRPLTFASLGGLMRPRLAEEIVDKHRLLGMDVLVRGSSIPIDDIEQAAPGEPVFEVTDPGPEPGSLLARLEAPFQVKKHPILQFYYRMAPNTAYSLLIRTRDSAPDHWLEIPMRLGQPRREGGEAIGVFDAVQDGRWHLLRFNLARALGGRDEWVAEAVLGEWGGATSTRTLYFKDFRIGPGPVKILPRNPDNEVRVLPADGALRSPTAGQAVSSATSATSTNLHPVLLGTPERLDQRRLRATASRGDEASAARALDGDPSTRWDTGRPQNGTEWFRVDLPSDTVVSEIRLESRIGPMDHPRLLLVWVSMDGRSFERVAASPGEGTTSQVRIDPPLQCRSLLLEQKGTDPVYWWAIDELILLGRLGPAQMPTPDLALEADGALPAKASEVVGHGELQPEVVPLPASAASQTQADLQAPPERVRSGAALLLSPRETGVDPQIDSAEYVVSSSRQGDPHLALRAVDRDPSTRWDTGRPQSGDEWFRVDLKHPFHVSRFELSANNSPNDFPRQLAVLASADGVSFHSVGALRPDAPESSIRLDASVATCSLRLEQKGADPVYWWSIHELALFGTPAPGLCPGASGAPLSSAQPGAAAGMPEARSGPAPEVPAEDLRVNSFRSDVPELAAQAIDRLASSRWDTGRPQSGAEWFQIEMPGPGEVSRIRLRVEGAPLDFPRRLQVSVSLDGASFRVVDTIEGTSPDTEVRFESPVRCRWIRLEQLGRDPVHFWSINELTVWGWFPPKERSWIDHVRYPKAWLAAMALLVTAAGAWVTSRRRGPSVTGRFPVVAAQSPPERLWLTAGVLTLTIFGLILLWTQNDYGETWDEWEHFENGEEYVNYLFDGGATPELYGHVFRKYYAPFSDILATLTKRILADRLGWASPEWAFHLHLNLLFVISGGVLFLVIRREDGGRSAWYCLAAYFLSPHLLGHCHNNMKDFAVTAWTVIAVFSFHSAAQRRSYPGMALAGAFAGCSIATKINGLILGPIELAYAILFVFLARAPGESLGGRLRFIILGAGLVHWVTALSTLTLAWPWLWEAPFARLAEALRFFRHHIWNGLVLYKGQMIHAADMPRDYAPLYVLITTPIAWLPLAALGLVRGVYELRRGFLLAALVSLAFFTPVAVEVFTNVPIYDGVRHFLSAFPFLACLVGLGLEWVIKPLVGGVRGRVVAAVLSILVLGSALYEDIRLHPYQSTYFNRLVGGGKGAMGRFELDYWGNSLKEAGRYVNLHAAQAARVHVIPDLGRLARLREDLTQSTIDPDWGIVLCRESLAVNPYDGIKPEFEVQADGAVLAKVYRFTDVSKLLGETPEPTRPSEALESGAIARGYADAGMTRLVASEPVDSISFRLDGPPFSGRGVAGVVWDGFVQIREEGAYSFLLSSDQPSRLHIGSSLVIENRPSRELFEKSARVRLRPGLYALKVEFWPGHSLKLGWRGPDQAEYLDVPVRR
jgi:hypothetical protein